MDRIRAGLDQGIKKELLKTFKVSNKRAFNVQKYGFPIEYVKRTLEKNECNFCSTVYYLEEKDQTKIVTTIGEAERALEANKSPKKSKK
jgi:hypothetical protein